MDKYQILNRLLNQNKSLPYQTNLNTPEQFAFADWASSNKVPVNLGKNSDYDMQGFYKAMQANDPNAQTAISDKDNSLHFNDKFKTPMHETFSNESIYATPSAPHWDGNALKNPDNSVKALEIPNEVLKIEDLLKKRQ